MSIDTAAQGPPPPPPGPQRNRIALSTAIFALATALSRIAGLAREVIQASFFATGVAISAFTIASQIPNLVANLFSQAALSAAFVPVFTELLQQGRKREAFKLASDLFWLILRRARRADRSSGSGSRAAIMPLFTGTSCTPTRSPPGCPRLFPVVLLLSLTGLLVGILQSYDRFTVPALAPAVLERASSSCCSSSCTSRLHGGPHDQDSVYAYAIAWLVAPSSSCC